METEEFITALKYGLDRRHISIPVSMFAGWNDDCTCPACACQKKVFTFLISLGTEPLPYKPQEWLSHIKPNTKP